MKAIHHRRLASCILALAASLFPATAMGDSSANIKWGSLDFSTFVDSYGNPLAPNDYTFALGAFEIDFIPDQDNVNLWYDNWTAFDTTTYNTETGVFTSSFSLFDYKPGGTSDFDNLGLSREAYLWVYNSTIPEPGTEWFLARAANWEFPELTSECCNNNLPIEWSMSDLNPEDPINPITPIWGGQFQHEGSGILSNPDSNADLQTYTFIPEPSPTLLIALAGLMAAMRRKR